MVKVGLAAVAEDSRFIRAPVTGIDTDGNGSGANCCFQAVSVARSNHGPWFAGVQELFNRGGLTSTLNSFVGISTLGCNTSIVDIVESPLRPGTIAALAQESLLATAVNQLLLGEVRNCTLFELVSRLKQAGSGEGPA